MSTLLLLLLLGDAGGAAPIDAPDARADIVDIRHARPPTRHRMLGWTADGAAVERDIECDLNDASGLPFCRATITVARPDASPKGTVLLDKTWLDFDFGCRNSRACYPLSRRDASRFIRAERRALDAIGPITPGTRQARGSWHIGADALRLDHDGFHAALVAGERKKIVRALPDDGDHSLRAAAITEVTGSPDGKRVAVRVDFENGDKDFYWHDFAIVVVPAGKD